MKKMTRKKHLWIPLTLMLLASIAMVNVPVKASSPVKIYVKPEPPTYIPGRGVGEVFDIELWIDSPAEWTNTPDGIVGWSLYLEVDPAVLEPMFVTAAQSGFWVYDFLLNNGHWSYLPPNLLVDYVNTTKGSFDDVSVQIAGWEELGVGAGGSGKIANFTFESLSVAFTTVNITEAYYYTKDGQFAADVGIGLYETPPNYEANLVGRSAWKEHAHFDRSKHGDTEVPDAKGTPGYQTLFAKIKNIGDANVTVKAEFRVYKDAYDETWYTTENETEPGQIIVLTFDFAGKDGSPPWDIEDDGLWRIEAKCLYLDPLAGWQYGTKVKTTKFACVP